MLKTTKHGMSALRAARALQATEHHSYTPQVGPKKQKSAALNSACN
jgi:hypothetical protein